MDQEKWSDEGATFMALRQTLLMKLLSTEPQSHRSEQVTVIDLTDSLLHSTGLDGPIMDIALHEFITSEDGSKMLGTLLLNDRTRLTL